MQQPLFPSTDHDGAAVLVIGDIMVDRYLHGRVHRISPEAPVPVVNYERERCLPGGAANVALNIRALDMEPILLAVCGDDAEQQTLVQTLEQAGLDASLLVCERGRKTTVKTRVLAGSQHLLRVDREDSHPIGEETRQLLLERVEEVLRRRKPQAILLQDYDKGLFSPGLIAAIVQQAGTAGIPVAVDPKFRHFMAYRGVDLFKPNLKELSEGLGRPVAATADDLLQATDELHRLLGHRISLITLSEKGIFWRDHMEGGYGIATPVVRDILDVCGAGDTVIAVAVVALVQGMPLPEIARLANLAGGQVCEHQGVVPVNLRDLQLEYQHASAAEVKKSVH
jgi:rfaE bifunctional protein kinase chain/domain